MQITNTIKFISGVAALAVILGFSSASAQVRSGIIPANGRDFSVNEIVPTNGAINNALAGFVNNIRSDDYWTWRTTTSGVLSVGAVGEGIAKLIRTYVAFGFLPLDVIGASRFGDQTIAATANLQNNLGITGDQRGSFGISTRSALTETIDQFNAAAGKLPGNINNFCIVYKSSIPYTTSCFLPATGTFTSPIPLPTSITGGTSNFPACTQVGNQNCCCDAYQICDANSCWWACTGGMACSPA